MLTDIADVVVQVQEMLHLSLAGNRLCSLALDGYMDLYDFPIFPQFPGTILFEEVELNLDWASQENLICFKEVWQQSCFG